MQSTSSAALTPVQPALAEDKYLLQVERKSVRFLISPPPSPPEHEMVDSGLRRSTRIAQRPPQVVSTTDPAPEKKKFGPVNKWGKEQLGWLNVAFIKEELDLNQIIPGFGGSADSQFQIGIHP